MCVGVWVKPAVFNNSRRFFLLLPLHALWGGGNVDLWGKFDKSPEFVWLLEIQRRILSITETDMQVFTMQNHYSDLFCLSKALWELPGIRLLNVLSVSSKFSVLWQQKVAVMILRDQNLYSFKLQGAWWIELWISMNFFFCQGFCFLIPGQIHILSWEISVLPRGIWVFIKISLLGLHK